MIGVKRVLFFMMPVKRPPQQQNKKKVMCSPAGREKDHFHDDGREKGHFHDDGCEKGPPGAKKKGDEKRGGQGKGEDLGGWR